MKHTIFTTFALALAASFTGAHAQAPAGAPAGAMGICKDGSYSMQAKKEGACRGHKGVQTWYVASAATPPAPAPAASAPPAPALPAPTQANRPAAPTMPAPSAATTAPTAMPAPTSKRTGPATAAAQRPIAPGGGPGLVWLNTPSNVYHCPGTTYYGKTKAGAYMSEADAKAKGAHNQGGKDCPAR